MNKKAKECKRIYFSLILLFIFIFITSGGTALAAIVYTEEDFYYELQDESIVITGYFGSDTEITLPNKIAGYPLSKIASGAFIGTTVKVINLPDTIMTIEEDAIAAGITVNYVAEQNGNQSSNKENTENDSAESKENVGGKSDSNADIDKIGQADEVEINIEDNQLEENKSVNNLKTDKAYVNNNGYLVTKDDDGREIVIDDSKKYMETTDADGKSVTKDLTESKDESKKRIDYIIPIIFVVVVLCNVFVMKRKNIILSKQR